MSAQEVSGRDSSARSQAHALLEVLADESVTELFDDYGVPIERAPITDEAMIPIRLSGVIGFTGPGLSGSCVLSASEEPIARSKPAPGTDYDWISELVNQLVGRIKNKLLRHGAVVFVTTPVVLKGCHVLQMSDEDHPLTYRAQPGNVLLSIELETSEEFALGEPEPSADEGALLFF